MNTPITYVEGDLLVAAKAGKFDAIVHGCNCFCTQKKGIAPLIAKAFGSDKFPLETKQYKGDRTKLGKIDYQTVTLPSQQGLTIINAYTQYDYRGEKPFDPLAFRHCMQAINSLFKGAHIGMPLIGAGLAGGDWDEISKIIAAELTNCQVTVVRLQQR
ncbi:macro domain-containing protein [Chitinophaga sp. LS1]|uniref:macro domain-containing protein n=1 Tax=Chitinophaga sp. LS1 TaxID=3051176 RepID=UPI002AAA7D00|nr:macro domain-containing protein [Chitinophaga sp. LS1]WPV65727.1 macro domain-containing protein [Chitinophaga sp. LS1]